MPVNASSFQHDFPFDPTYGYDQEALLGIAPPPAPEDFEDFWTGCYQKALGIDPSPTLREIEGTPDARVFEISYRSWDDVMIGGWLVHPRKGEIRRGMVVGHGYGGREGPDLIPRPQTAMLFPCMRGQSRSRTRGLPEPGGEHVVHGIDQRETYIHLGCAAEIWCGVTVLHGLFPGQLEHMGYQGGSFGGGIGALALPWDSRIHAGFLTVPSFGNHPIRLQCPCTGSGESVRKYVTTHPEIVDRVLPYFDAAIAASRIRIPMLIAPALFDPAVPPPGQYCVYNALPGPKQIYHLSAGHFDYPPDQDRENRELADLATQFFLA